MTDLTTLPDRALSIRQPWAWAILYAGKDIENRSRRVNYRGPICIHASSFAGRKYYAFASHEIWEVGLIDTPFDLDVPRGGIIGTAEIVDCVEASDSPWFFGPFGLVLANVKPVPFIPVKGALGMFKWKRNVVAGE